MKLERIAYFAFLMTSCARQSLYNQTRTSNWHILQGSGVVKWMTGHIDKLLEEICLFWLLSRWVDGPLIIREKLWNFKVISALLHVCIADPKKGMMRQWYYSSKSNTIVSSYPFFRIPFFNHTLFSAYHCLIIPFYPYTFLSRP